MVWVLGRLKGRDKINEAVEGTSRGQAVQSGGEAGAWLTAAIGIASKGLASH